MFTGIIEQIGKLRRQALSGSEPFLELEAPMARSDLAIGDSVSVNGVCLTVRTKSSHSFTVNVSRETVNLTTFAHLKPGVAVNLERALQATARLDGHLVQGHVDHVGKVAAVAKGPGDYVLTIGYPQDMAALLVEKGSVAVDGISLTITALTESTFAVHVIPQTWENTIIQYYQPGQIVNLEADVLGRYVVRWLELTARPRAFHQDRG